MSYFFLSPLTSIHPLSTRTARYRSMATKRYGSCPPEKSTHVHDERRSRAPPTQIKKNHHELFIRFGGSLRRTARTGRRIPTAAPVTTVRWRVGLFEADNYNTAVSSEFSWWSIHGRQADDNDKRTLIQHPTTMGLTPLYFLLGLGVFRFFSSVQVNSPLPEPKKIDFHFHFRRLSLIIFNPLCACGFGWMFVHFYLILNRGASSRHLSNPSHQ